MQVITKLQNIYYEVFDYEFCRLIKQTWFLLLLPFIGVLFMVTIGDFTIGDTEYDKFTWLWIVIAMMWGMIIGRNKWFEFDTT